MDLLPESRREPNWTPRRTCSRKLSPRRGIGVSLLTLLGALATPSAATAGATVDLLFVSHDGPSAPGPIAPTRAIGQVAPGDELEMAVVLRNDEPLFVAAFSLLFDAGAASGADELDVRFALSWSGIRLGPGPSDRFDPITDHFVPVIAGGGSPGRIGPFGGSAQNFSVALLPPGSYQVGTVFWRVRLANEILGGDDILSGLFNTGVDGFGDAAFQEMSARVLFNGASIGIPEPATAALLALALAALGAARRWRIGVGRAGRGPTVMKGVRGRS